MAEQVVAGADTDGDVLVICGTTLISWAVIARMARQVPGSGRAAHHTRQVGDRRAVERRGALRQLGGALAGVDRWQRGTRSRRPARCRCGCPTCAGERVPFHDPHRRASLHDLDIGMTPAPWSGPPTRPSASSSAICSTSPVCPHSASWPPVAVSARWTVDAGAGRLHRAARRHGRGARGGRPRRGAWMARQTAGLERPGSPPTGGCAPTTGSNPTPDGLPPPPSATTASGTSPDEHRRSELASEDTPGWSVACGAGGAAPRLEPGWAKPVRSELASEEHRLVGGVRSWRSSTSRLQCRMGEARPQQACERGHTRSVGGVRSWRSSAAVGTRMGEARPQRACERRTDPGWSVACGAGGAAPRLEARMGEARPQRACERGHTRSVGGVRSWRSSTAVRTRMGEARPQRACERGHRQWA